MNKYLIKLPENRVRRNYRGGAGIDRFKARSLQVDGDRPEEWIASTTKATNPGLETIPDEGISYVIDQNGEKRLLTDLFTKDPIHYLGKNRSNKDEIDTGFLFKILDSAMRLHLQAHPTREFARAHLNSRYGKLETYYILAVREGTNGYIRLGFQKQLTPAEWKDIVYNQKIDEMDACFENIPVAPGEIWLVPGGVPHAIGEGVTVLEIMEPSDLVVRCEFEREGIIVPEDARFMQRDPDFAMEIFDHASQTKDEVRERYRVTPKTIINHSEIVVRQLIGPEQTDCFEVLKLEVTADSTYKNDDRMNAGVVIAGSATLHTEEETLSINEGDAFVIAAASNEIHVKPDLNSPFQCVLVKGVSESEDIEEKHSPRR